MLLARIEKASFKNLVITVDYPVPPNSENNVQSGFSSSLRPSLRLLIDGWLRPRWLFGIFIKTLINFGVPHFENNYATRGTSIISRNVNRDFSGRSHLNWESLALVRRLWSGTLIVKSILHSNEAIKAEVAGADSIVSYHCRRQLDGAIAPMNVLSPIVTAVSLPVMIDSGF